MTLSRGTRRTFLKTAAAFGAAGLLSRGALGLPQDSRPAPKEKLKILILGGTAFLGPEIVEAATRRGHTMTLFNRGKTRPELFPDIEKLRGDRDKNDYAALKDRKFDAVIDTSAYVPREVREAAAALAGNAGQYVFISSVSVYKDGDAADTDESSPVATIADATTEKVDGETYGALKALCEQAAETAMPGRTTNIRPGLIVGPGDFSDRWSYWPIRVAQGGEVLAPGKPDWTIQYIDVRDLAEWIVAMIETKTMGVFNALGPQKPTPMGVFLDTAKQVSGSDATFVWADLAFMAEHKVAPWSDMPAWLPPGPGADRPPIASNARAMQNGLRFRPLEATIADTLAWHKKRDPKRPLRAGIKREREKEVLAAWHAREKAEKR
jgi:2'-hydroxyisoflavone reductase